MKLSEWARKQGISYRTAWRWFKAGQLPVTAVQTATGTILVEEAETADVLTSFCVRLYGRRSAKHKAKQAMASIGIEDVV